MDDRTKTEAWPGQQTTPVAPPHEAPPPRDVPPRRGGWVGRAIIWLLLIAACAGTAYWYFQRPEPTRARGGRSTVPPVATVAVASGDVNVTINALGTVTSLATIAVRSQISGQLVAVNYTEGQIVKKGDQLAEIDSRPYQLALSQAEGALKRDQALLQSAKLDLERYTNLSQTNAIPRQQLDQQRALVQQDEGNIITDQAQIDTAKLNITYAHIVAPVNGRLGLRLVDPGNYVTPGDANGLVVITQLSPISVMFTTAEDNLPAIIKRLAAVPSLQATAFDRSGSNQLAVGTMSTLDNQIDTTTGTVKLRAQFENTDGALFPNQFVNIRLLVDTLKNTPVVPSSAIQRGAPGTFVYLVDPKDSKVSVRKVVLGPVDGDRVAITSGLQAGDVVVVDGADKLKDGIAVTIRSGPGATAAPPAAAAPGDQRQRRRRNRDGN
jgi:multidrug efflux system membrane fusion protein